ncbi:MAG: hypothetical protein JO100_02925 [Pseudonocardia sp.]|nr:hypothetical protein [Pseudonocardia sp.]
MSQESFHDESADSSHPAASPGDQVHRFDGRRDGRRQVLHVIGSLRACGHHLRRCVAAEQDDQPGEEGVELAADVGDLRVVVAGEQQAGLVDGEFGVAVEVDVQEGPKGACGMTGGSWRNIQEAIWTKRATSTSGTRVSYRSRASS